MRPMKFSLNFLVTCWASNLICLGYIFYIITELPEGMNGIFHSMKDARPYVSTFLITSIVCLFNNFILISIYLLIHSLCNDGIADD